MNVAPGRNPRPPTLVDFPESRSPGVPESRSPGVPESRGAGAGRREAWLTFPVERTLLTVVRTTATLNRLLDVLSLTAPDRRIQTVFALDAGRPAVLGAGAPTFLASLGGTVLTWPEALRSRADLVLAASENDDLDAFDGPVLVVPHGAGQQKFYPGTSTVSGLDPGRAARATFALADAEQAARLARVRPHAAAHVVGDPALGRMIASSHRAGRYRRRLDDRGRRIVVLASTWGPDSLLGQWPDLPQRLAADLPHDEYRLVIVLHPGAWAKHSAWQIRAWLANSGARLVPPEEGWQAALLAAHCVLSDHGSLAVYAAALGRPLLLAPRPSAVTVPGSASARLAERARRLEPRAPLREQIDTATAPPVGDEAIGSPATTATRLRELMYALLRLPEPAYPAAFPLVPPPVPEAGSHPVLIAGAVAGTGEVAVRRFAAIDAGTGADLAYRHVVADLDEAALDALGAAHVLLTRDADEDEARRLLAEWPRAVLVADAGRSGCRIWSRDDGVLLSAPDRVDPGVLASYAYVCLRRDGALPRGGTLRVGDRLIPVVAG